jgi:hypothetical protein
MHDVCRWVCVPVAHARAAAAVSARLVRIGRRREQLHAVRGRSRVRRSRGRARRVRGARHVCRRRRLVVPDVPGRQRVSVFHARTDDCMCARFLLARVGHCLHTVSAGFRVPFDRGGADRGVRGRGGRLFARQSDRVHVVVRVNWGWVGVKRVVVF